MHEYHGNGTESKIVVFGIGWVTGNVRPFTEARSFSNSSNGGTSTLAFFA